MTRTTAPVDPVGGDTLPAPQTMNPIAALDAILAQLNEALPQAPHTRANIITGLRPHIDHLVAVLAQHGYKPKAG